MLLMLSMGLSEARAIGLAAPLLHQTAGCSPELLFLLLQNGGPYKVIFQFSFALTFCDCYREVPYFFSSLQAIFGNTNDR